jgi:1,4-dihydroxy-2-naphthoate octaprenyltransferase
MVGTPSDGPPGRWYRQLGMVATLRGLWLEVRVIPVLLWSFSALTAGTALAATGRSLEVWYYVGAVALGVLIQGLLAHCMNELADWRSGTDQHPSPRVISGGSKVIAAGLLGEGALRITFAGAFLATTVLGLALVAARGLVVLPFGLVGVAGAIVYTLPPVRAAYRPFAGEAIAFVCLANCVIGAYVLQDGPAIDAAVLATAVAVAAYAVGMLMVHHYLDRDADRAATPPKVTSIVRLGLVDGRRYAIAWCVLALVAAMAGSAVQPRLLPLVAGYAVGLLAHLRCRPDDVESVTKNELAIIFAGIAAALGASALLVPALSVVMVVAVVLVAVEMRLAVAPAGTPAA